MCWDFQPLGPLASEESTQNAPVMRTPPQTLYAEDVERLLSSWSRMTPTQVDTLVQTSPKRTQEKDDWESEWRRQIAYSWQYVFAEITSFLSRAKPSTGTWTFERRKDDIDVYGHSMGIFPIFYEDTFPEKSWPSTNAIVMPMFIDKGALIDFDARVKEPGIENLVELHLVDWDNDPTRCDALYVRKDSSVFITVEDKREDESKGKPGLAGVFVFATLLRVD